MPQICAEPGRIFAESYQDSYFSHTNGFAETQHVFLGGNQLEKRWQNNTLTSFTIGELGFGTGLNCLCAWALWRQFQPNKILSYIAFELNPLDYADVAITLSPWPVLSPLLAELWATPLPKTQGIHTVMRDGLHLTLVLGDARALLPAYPATQGVDAWFLDGFAPNRNPELWETDLLSNVYRLTTPGGTAATYSAAGHVRRTLQGVGFHVTKCRGFAQKREMLTAQKLAENLTEFLPETLG